MKLLATNGRDSTPRREYTRCSELALLVVDSALWRSAIPWVVLCLVLANIGIAHWTAALAEERRKNLTSADVGALNASLRCDATYGNAPLSTWRSIPDANKQPLVILCGMSQMFSINERKAGDQSISEEMDDRLAPQGIRVHGLAAPNLCNEEALFLLLALLENPNTKPRAFIYGVCFDKMRNIDLRPGYQEFLKSQPPLQAAWKQTAESYGAKYRLATDKMLKTLGDLQSTQQAEDTIESRLREKVAAWLPVVAARKDLNGYAQMKLFLLRNAILNVKPESKRPIIKNRYDMNLEFLQVIIDICDDSGIQLILYVIPINPLADNPYIPEEYAAFKRWLGELTAARRVPFANLEDLVPTEEWGEFMGGPDFKHFKGSGHRRTAVKLLEVFGRRLKGLSAGE